MLRPFVGKFLLPLVEGGALHVGRPLDLHAVAVLTEAWLAPEARRAALLGLAEQQAAGELSRRRGQLARTLLPDAGAPPLDETSLRLGAAIHNLLLLSHPSLGQDVVDRTRGRIADAARDLGDIGAPRSAEEAVRRHSLLARVPEIVQPERLVSYWLGRQRFVGRVPPARLLALPRLRRVRLEETQRQWLREVGVASCARSAWAALQRASPLGEALDPLRLDPPPAWGRMLPVLRFPSLARLAIGRVMELGLIPAGSALATSLFQYASTRDGGGGRAGAAGVVFGIRFLAHAVWLQLLFGGDEVAAAGGDLAALLVAAAEVDARLVYPPDVSPSSDAGLRLRRTLDQWRDWVSTTAAERHRMALGVARHAAREAMLGHELLT